MTSLVFQDPFVDDVSVAGNLLREGFEKHRASRSDQKVRAEVFAAPEMEIGSHLVAIQSPDRTVIDPLELFEDTGALNRLHYPVWIWRGDRQIHVANHLQAPAHASGDLHVGNVIEGREPFPQRFRGVDADGKKKS